MKTYLVSVEKALCGQVEVQAASAEVAAERALKKFAEEGEACLLDPYEDTSYTGIEAAG